MEAKLAENPGKVKIDKKDIEIIKILEEDGRISIMKLAGKVKLSHETVRYRLNKLIKSEIIEKFTVNINERKLGYDILAVVMISTWNYSKEDWEEFFGHLMENINVVSIAKVTGDYDLKIAIMAKTPEEFDFISHAIKTKFSKIIKNWQTFIFTKEYKWKELPL